MNKIPAYPVIIIAFLSFCLNKSVATSICKHIALVFVGWKKRVIYFYVLVFTSVFTDNKQTVLFFSYIAPNWISISISFSVNIWTVTMQSIAEFNWFVSLWNSVIITRKGLTSSKAWPHGGLKQRNLKNGSNPQQALQGLFYNQV